MFMERASAIILTLTISGCAWLPAKNRFNNQGVDGIACMGTISAHSGLSETNNSALKGKAQGQSTKGGVCSAKSFTVTTPITLYRVYDANKDYTKYGGWRSFNRPTGSRDNYRAANAICKDWSPLDRLVACEIRPGSEIVIGTTQSANCEDGSTYPKTAENQVYVPNDNRAGIIHVGACTEEPIWQ